MNFAACGGEKSFCRQLLIFSWVEQVGASLHHLHQLNHFFQPFYKKISGQEILI